MREIAQALAIPVAAGRAILPDDTADMLIAEAGLPLAIKPNALLCRRANASMRATR